MSWLDTTGHSGPRSYGSNWEQARWLVGRHPVAARLVERIGAADKDEDDWWVDVDALRDTVRGADAYRRAWADYEHRSPPPRTDDDAVYEAWQDAGPQADKFGPEPGVVHAFLVMSGTEQGRLRLLATLGEERVEFCTGDLSGWDDGGRAFLRDWVSLL